VHPLDEAQGFAALMPLEEPKYSIEQIGAKVGKNPVYIAARLKLVELTPAVVESFAKDEIGVGHYGDYDLNIGKIVCFLALSATFHAAYHDYQMISRTT
jgi:hypothetical protein